MEGGIRIFLLKLTSCIGLTMSLLLALQSNAIAAGLSSNEDEQLVRPEITRRTLTIDAIDTENFEVELFGGVISVEDFGVNPVYGVRLAYHITEDFFAQGSYGQTKTGENSWERLDTSNSKLLTDKQRKLTYYNFSLGYNILPGEVFVGGKTAFTTQFYLIAGIGSTEFAGGDHFTTNFGAGYRFLGSDWFALHIDVRDHIFEIELLEESRETHNIEFTGGISLFF
ncbi:MAG: outer membrane beta-barrel domain-containing protein [Candidatus Polarisedimenticolaceae bacterium]|nr:outer membrane beta-barrel domain-containing protein [Candidatus Polarisedimenticolaceae bacterium]